MCSLQTADPYLRLYYLLLGQTPAQSALHVALGQVDNPGPTHALEPFWGLGTEIWTMLAMQQLLFPFSRLDFSTQSLSLAVFPEAILLCDIIRINVRLFGGSIFFSSVSFPKLSLYSKGLLLPSSFTSVFF